MLCNPDSTELYSLSNVVNCASMLSRDLDKRPDLNRGASVVVQPACGAVRQTVVQHTACVGRSLGTAMVDR